MLVATAGHVDHGKTVLVRALTGVDTDRLPEEKARGLSIDLGFAYRPLDDDRVLGFVDVPGHERFVRNMIAGVPAIDLALLVVAADDGPMPQTREHLAILDLLGIRRGLAAITKIDAVDAARVDAVRAEVETLLAATTLAGAPCFAVSGLTGEGVPALERALLDAAAALAPRAGRGGFRMAIDRAFTVPGAGLVVTGAAFAGRVAAGDRLRLVPGDREVRVRGVRAHDRDTGAGRAGERCALNVAGPGIERDTVHRGQWLVAPESGATGTHVDVRLRVLAAEPCALAHWTPVHVHHGAAAIHGRVATLEGRAIAPGAEALAQLVLDRPTHAAFGDRVVLRDQSARSTIAGGYVVDPIAPRRGRTRPERIAVLHALDAPDDARALAAVLDAAPDGVDLAAFARARNLAPDRGAALADDADPVRLDARGAPLATSRARAASLRAALLDALDRWHAEHADAFGPDEAALLAAARAAGAHRLAAGTLAALLREGAIRRVGRALARPDHRPVLPAADRARWDRVAAHLAPDVLQPPVVFDLARTLELEPPALAAFLQRCAARGLLVRLAANRFVHHAAAARLAAIAEHLGAGGARFDARAYRDATGIGRNFTIEVLEHFDAAGLTRRIGDERIAVGRARELFGAADDDAS